VEWERNTVSLSTRVLFRKRRIFQPDKWNSWSNARERDNAERMILLYARHLCALFLALRSRRFGAVTKKDHGNKNQSSPRRHARVHIPRSDMVRGYSVQAFRYTGYNPCARTHICTSNSSFFLSFSLSFLVIFFSGPERPQKSELKRTTQYTRLAFISGRDKFYRGAWKHEKCSTSRFKKGVCGARCICHVRCIRMTMRLDQSHQKRYDTDNINNSILRHSILDSLIKLSFDTVTNCVFYTVLSWF